MTDVAFRAASSGRTGTVNAGLVTLDLPAAAQAGDLCVIGYEANSLVGDTGGQGVIGDPAGITGWTALSAQLATSSAIAKGWYKILTADDIATGTLTVDYTGDTANNRCCMICGCWSGADPTTPVVVTGTPLQSTTSSASHVMPSVDTTGDGAAMIVSMLLCREATGSSAYTASSGWTMRLANLDSPAGQTGGRAQSAIIDSGTQQAAGSGNGGGTITGDQAGQHNFGYTLAIAPAAAVATARPVTDITTTGWTPSTTPGGAMCSLLADTDDATYVTSPAAPSAQVFEAKLPAMSAAPSTVTARVEFAGGAVSGTVVTALVQGTTVIASRTDTFASDPPDAWTDLVLTLTSGQQAAVTDLADLRIRVTATAA